MNCWIAQMNSSVPRHNGEVYDLTALQKVIAEGSEWWDACYVRQSKDGTVIKNKDVVLIKMTKNSGDPKYAGALVAIGKVTDIDSDDSSIEITFDLEKSHELWETPIDYDDWKDYLKYKPQNGPILPLRTDFLVLLETRWPSFLK